jgi:thioredoxin-related protein
MKKLIAILFLIAVSLGARAETSDWLTDYGVAKKKAKQENKPILALFTGSDWCPICQKWEKEVFSTAQFQEYAKENLVLLLVDFPDKKPLPKAQERANDTLKYKYKVDEFPMAVLINSKGKQIDSFHYIEGGPNALLGKIGSTREGSVAKKQ